MTFFSFFLLHVYRKIIDFPKLTWHMNSLILIIFLQSHMAMQWMKEEEYHNSFTCKIILCLYESSLCTVIINVLIFSLYSGNSSSILVTVSVSQNLCWLALPAHMNFCKLHETWVTSDYLFHFNLDSVPL